MSERATLSGQLADQHELLMAFATKPPQRGRGWSVTAEQQKIGDLKGQWLGGLTVSNEDGEDWPAFIGRMSQMHKEFAAHLDYMNSLERQLEESVKK